MFHVLVDLKQWGFIRMRLLFDWGRKFDPTNCEQTDDTFILCSRWNPYGFPECYAESQTILWWLQQMKRQAAIS